MTRPARYPWSEEEKAQLLAEGKKMGLKVFAAIHDRSHVAVRLMFHRMRKQLQNNDKSNVSQETAHA